MTTRDRILSHLIPDSRNCWLWQLSTQNGYGRVRIGNRMPRVHRAMWELWFGPIPDGLDVLHTCDIPACANPDHLFLGTDADNVRDRQTKGRSNGGSSPGESHPNASLTQADVDFIRSEVAIGPRGTAQKLARRFGVGPTHISRIVSGKRWAA